MFYLCIEPMKAVFLPLITSLQGKLDIFREYCQQLHSSDNLLLSDGDWFLKTVHMGVLSFEHKQYLDEPIVIKEIVYTIDLFKSNKAPGLDGLSAEF